MSRTSNIKIFSRTRLRSHQYFYPKGAWKHRPMQILAGEHDPNYRFNVSCFRGLISYNNTAWFEGFITNTSIPMPHIFGEMHYSKVALHTKIIKYKGGWYFGEWYQHGTITVIEPFDINSIRHLLPITKKPVHTTTSTRPPLVVYKDRISPCISDGERLTAKIVLLTILCTLAILEPLATLFGFITASIVAHFC